MSGFLKLAGSLSAPVTGSAADGYVAFFTGTSTLAGDNDLYWDRVNNRLELKDLAIGQTSKLYFDSDKNSYIYASSDNIISIYTDGSEKVYISSGAIVSKVPINMTTSYIYSNTRPLQLGGNFVTSHGLTNNDVGIYNDLEVDGYAYFDGGVGIAGNVHASTLLNNATGDEVAYKIEYEVNKATSGNDYGLYIDKTDSSSPGTSYLAWFGVDGGDEFTVDDAGNVIARSWFSTAGITDNYQLGLNSRLYFRTNDGDGVLMYLRENNNSTHRNLIMTDYINRDQDHGHNTISTNPTLFLHSSTDVTVDNTQWLSFYHDQTNAQIKTGSGGITLDPASEVIEVDGYIYDNGNPLRLGSDAVSNHDATTGDVIIGNDLEINGQTKCDDILFIYNELLAMSGSSVQARFRSGPDDGFRIALDPDNGRANNNLIITSSNNYSKDHDHDTPSTNPTLFIHSSLDPDTNNTRWGSLTQTGTENYSGTFKLSTGSGSIHLQPAYDGYVSVGEGTPGNISANGDNLYVAGTMEVDGVSYFDSRIEANAGLNAPNFQPIVLGGGNANNFILMGSTSLHQATISLGTNMYHHLIVTHGDNYTTAHNHGDQTNPTVFIHSAEDPGVDDTQWLGFHHDQTNARIEVGSGDLNIDTDVVIDGYEKVNGNLEVNGQMYSPVVPTLIPTGTTQTVDWDDGNSQAIDLDSASGDVTLTLSNPKAGATYTIKVIQGGTTRNITWPGTVLWPAGIAPIITAANDSIDLVTLYFDGANYLGSFSQDFQ